MKSSLDEVVEGIEIMIIAGDLWLPYLEHPGRPIINSARSDFWLEHRENSELDCVHQG